MTKLYSGTTATLQSDGHGNRTFIVATPGMPQTTVRTPDAYFVCNNSLQACKKYPVESAAGVDSNTYDAAQIKNLRATTKYMGQKKCPDGKSTCNVWFLTTKDNTTTYYFVNAATKQIVRYLHNGYLDGFKNKPKATIDITYTYKKVNVTIPTKYTVTPNS